MARVRVCEWLSYEVFNSGLSVAQLLVALLGIPAGGWAAGKTSAIARMRVEDRRIFVDQVLPQLLRPHFPGGTDDCLDEVALTAWLEAFQKGRDLMRLHPWVDRKSWAEIERTAPEQFVRSALSKARLAGDDGASAVALRDEWYERYVTDERPRELKRRERTDWQQALLLLDDHLNRELRPGFWRRPAGWFYLGRLATRWPRRWLASALRRLFRAARPEPSALQTG